MPVFSTKSHPFQKKHVSAQLVRIAWHLFRAFKGALVSIIRPRNSDGNAKREGEVAGKPLARLLPNDDAPFSTRKVWYTHLPYQRNYKWTKKVGPLLCFAMTGELVITGEG